MPDQSNRIGLTLTLKRKSGEETELVLRGTETPGPAAQGARTLDGPGDEPAPTGAPPSLGQIESIVLIDRASLDSFLERVSAIGGTVEMTCLQTRLARIRELLGASPASTEIEVPI